MSAKRFVSKLLSEFAFHRDMLEIKSPDSKLHQVADQLAQILQLINDALDYKIYRHLKPSLIKYGNQIYVQHFGEPKNDNQHAAMKSWVKQVILQCRIVCEIKGMNIMNKKKLASWYQDPQQFKSKHGPEFQKLLDSLRDSVQEQHINEK